MLRQIYYKLPPQYRFTARRLFYAPTDFWEKITGQRPPMTPPRGLTYTGSGDFVRLGDWWRDFFIENGGLKPSHRVLDVGSGIGRIARGLTSFLEYSPKKGFNTEGGTYDGFDVIKLGVDWCNKHIAARFPHFRFLYVPLKNDLYRNDGEQATAFDFPFQDDSFDLVILTSVFTHMVAEEVAHYLIEIQRVMDDKGVCVATFFILNNDSRKAMANNPHFNFPHDFGHYALMDAAVQSANVAFDEAFLEKIVAESGLTIKQKVVGFWSHGERSTLKDCYQDVWIFEKNEVPTN